MCLLSLFVIDACASAQLRGSEQGQASVLANEAQGTATSGAEVYEAAPVALSLLGGEPRLLAPLVLESPLLAPLTLSPLMLAPLTLEPAAASVLAAASTDEGAAPEGAFDTVIKLVNANSHEALLLEVSRDGHVRAESEPLVEAFFKCRRSGRAHAIEPGVLRVVAAIAREHPGRTIEVISGFRTKPYGVKDSKHFEGRAIDLRVRGVKLTKVRDFVWKHFADIGVGYYENQEFIHVDHRPDGKDTAWTSAHENAAYEFNPRWATRIRPPWRSPVGDSGSTEHEPSAGLAQSAQASLTSAM